MSNPLEQTIIPLWIGAGKTSGNAFLGAPGAALRGLGQLTGDYPEPTDEQLKLQSEIKRSMNEYLGLPENFLASSPFSQSQNYFTRLGNFLLGANAQLQENVNAAREDFIGNEENLYTHALEGLGAMSIPLMFGPIGKGITEAGAETGDFATGAYGRGKLNEEGEKVALKNFLTNLALNGGLSTIPNGKEILNKIDKLRKWGAMEEIMMNFGKEVLEEIFMQEPAQRIINDASSEAINGENNFMLNMIGGLGSYPRQVYEVMTGRNN